MFNRRDMLAAHLLLVGLLAACATTPRSVDGTSEGQALVRQWESAASSRNAAALAALYAEDASGLYAGAPARQGRDSIRVSWERFFETRFIEIMPRRVEVASSNDFAYTTGRYQVRDGAATGPLLEEGKYVQIWRRVNGDWRVIVDINNADAPSP